MLEKLPHAVGSALRGVRAGLERTIYAGPDLASVPELIRVTSPAFAGGGPIPERFTEDGEGTSPPVAWSGVPPAAAAVVLVIEDADSPTPAPIVHAIVVDLPGRDGALAEGALPLDGVEADEAVMGRNSFLGTEYLPPDPPPGHGPHRYVVQVFALSEALTIHSHPGRSAVAAALSGRVLARGCLIGTYERG